MTPKATLRSVSLLEQSRRKRPALANRMRKHPLIPRKRVPAPESEDAYPVSIFGPQHGLTPDQVWEAQRRYNEAVALRGHLKEGWRLAFRMGGIVSAILGGRVGNDAWGRSQRARRYGYARQRSMGPTLQEISQLGVQSRRDKAEMRRKYGRRYG